MDNLALDNPTGFDPNSGVVQFGRENQVFARFYRGTKRDNFASQEAGHPIEKGVDMIEIRQFGEKDSTVAEVNESHKMRFPQRWAQYEQGREQVQDGAPLDMLFPKNPEVVSTLKLNHIYTIEALAAAPDSTTGIPFIHDWKKKAQVFVEGINKGQGFHALEKKLEESELARLAQDDLIKTLSDRLAALEKDKPKAKD
jgi:hypothetical protein